MCCISFTICLSVVVAVYEGPKLQFYEAQHQGRNWKNSCVGVVSGVIVCRLLIYESICLLSSIRAGRWPGSIHVCSQFFCFLGSEHLEEDNVASITHKAS
ncbi:hypothetical protein QBC46DRAFT_381254 [Diplogelasinospora grovesii]|uniref:Uncharacterized protein n=1 Tax=Diplogelasinospora grovesii TaxID=303347 RepID=A0AAN6S5I5_9PEZI|nr:hypothetical protein QBC46DRAFT_381254 [Diplogelasinospora grovesii]